MPVVYLLLDELIESRLQIERSLDTVVHRVPPRVVVFHQFVHLRFASRPYRRDQATLNIFELFNPLWRSLDVLDDVVQLAARSFTPPNIHVPQLFVLGTEELEF